MDQEAVIEKPPLDHETLRDVIDLSLWAGQMLLQHGADTSRVESVVHLIGTSLGATWLDILVSPNALIVTTISGEEFRTKVRRVVTLGVNLSIVCAINDLAYRISWGEVDRVGARAELLRISAMRSNYNRWVVVGMVGLACAGLSRLFGSDLPVFAVTFLSAGTAMYVRQEMSRQHFNSFMIVVVTAFVAGLGASTATILHLSPSPQIALAASVLLLVPGVHLINSLRDMINGHMVTGLVRGFTGAVISMCIALGLLLAMQLMGVSGL